MPQALLTFFFHSDWLILCGLFLFCLVPDCPSCIMHNPFLEPYESYFTFSPCDEWYCTEPNISSLDFAMPESSWSEYVVLHSWGPLLGWIIWTQQRGFCPLFIQTQMPEDITSSLVKQLPTSQRYMPQTTSRDERNNSSNNLAQWQKHHRIYGCYQVFSSWIHSW